MSRGVFERVHAHPARDAELIPPRDWVVARSLPALVSRAFAVVTALSGGTYRGGTGQDSSGRPVKKKDSGAVFVMLGCHPRLFS